MKFIDSKGLARLWAKIESRIKAVSDSVPDRIRVWAGDTEIMPNPGSQTGLCYQGKSYIGIGNEKIELRGDGSNISIGVCEADGIPYLQFLGTDYTYVLPKATTSALGGVKIIGTSVGLQAGTYKLSVQTDGGAYTYIPDASATSDGLMTSAAYKKLTALDTVYGSTAVVGGKTVRVVGSDVIIRGRIAIGENSTFGGALAVDGSAVIGQTQAAHIYVSGDINHNPLQGEERGFYFNAKGDGYVRTTMTCQTLNQTSDERLKEGIVAVSDDERHKAESVEFIRFAYKADEKGRLHYGVSAQRLEAAGLESLVGEMEDGYKTVDYIGMLCLKVAALEARVKEQDARISALEAKEAKEAKG